MTASPRSCTSSPPTPQPNAHPPTLNHGGLLNLHSYDASITIQPASCGKSQAPSALSRAAGNTYFKAIQTAKRVHWSQFLANVDSQSVSDARKIAAGRAPHCFPTLEKAASPTEIINTLLQHFFPPRPSPPPPPILPAFKDAPPVSPAEVSSALRKSSNTSVPGPSGIPYSIWKQVH